MEEKELVETPEADESVNDDGAGALIMGKTGIVTKKSRKPRSKPAVAPVESDKTILISEGNIAWPGVGTLKVGFNVVSKTLAEKFVTLKKVREASVDEVKEYYGR